MANPYVANVCPRYCRCVYNTCGSEQPQGGLGATIVHRGEKEKLEHDN